MWKLIAVLTVFCWNGIPVSCLPNCLDKNGVVGYDLDSQVCCNGVHNRFQNEKDLQCCETFSKEGHLEKQELYDRKTAKCCDGVTYNLSPSQMRMQPECCADQIILDNTTEFCCGQRQYKYSQGHAGCFKRGNVTFPTMEGEIVCSVYVNNSPDFVNVKIYTKAEVEKIGSSCCGLELYRHGDQYFCFKKQSLWPRGSQPAECGPNRNIHDASKTVCCHDTGKTIPIPQDYIERYHGLSPNLACFQDSLVDLDKNKVVFDKDKERVIPKLFEPCGSDYYDKTMSRGNSVCCSGKVHYYSRDMDAECCGSELMDKNKNNCCNNSILPNTEKCCINKSYSQYDNVICCNGKLYNDSYLCCKPQTSIEIPTLKQKRHDNKCCGNTTYHHLQGTCCHGKVYGPEKICNFHGRRSNITKITRQILKKVNESIKTSPVTKDKDRISKHRGLDCPACLKYEEPFIDCVKKFRYQVFVSKIKINGNRTTIDVLFLEPKIMRKTRMVLHTAGKCLCFDENSIYNLYTNRNFHARIMKSKKFRSRFTERDIFYEVKGNYGYFSTEHRCQVGRFYKPFVKH